jgi:hypothetical protein
VADTGETDPLDFNSDDGGITNGYEVYISCTELISHSLFGGAFYDCAKGPKVAGYPRCRSQQQSVF